ncbi:MAG TPA: EamA family transporter, partial [Kofleriaceae bacterium]
MSRSITMGVALAAGAALAFGAVTPVIAGAGRGLGPVTIAALLYAGAAAAALAMQLGRRDGGGLRRGDLPRIAGVAVAGAAIAPVCLAWGLARTGATIGSLVLNLEAVLTVVLAWLVYREPIGRRVGVAVAV